MSAIAQEVSRRMTPGYAKERAKEMAKERAYEARDRAVDSPWVLPLIGAGIGALVGRALLGRAQERREAEWRREWERGRPYGSHGYVRRGWDRTGQAGSPGPQGAYGSSAEWDEDLAMATTETGDGGSAGVRERLSEGAASAKDKVAGKASELGDRASEMKDRLGARAGELGDRVKERATALRDRMPDRETIRSSAYEQPGMWALGAAAIGALFGFALPMSDKEREVLQPAKERMREATHQAMDRAVEKVEHMGGEAGGRETEHDVGGTQPSPGTTGLLTNPPGPDPIH